LTTTALGALNSAQDGYFSNSQLAVMTTAQKTAIGM
jgi:hypothetical protein